MHAEYFFNFLSAKVDDARQNGNFYIDAVTGYPLQVLAPFHCAAGFTLLSGATQNGGPNPSVSLTALFYPLRGRKMYLNDIFFKRTTHSGVG